jgi:hypothetical protein
MKLQDVTFERWMASHPEKPARERWLRELYPWPVIAEVDYAEGLVGSHQHIRHDGVDYEVTLTDVRWQPEHGTFRYAIRIACDGLGWNARSFDDPFHVCARPDGSFVTLFHASKHERLEKVARAFFERRWEMIDQDVAQTLAVSRFLSAALISRMLEDAYGLDNLSYHPTSRLTRSGSPLFVRRDGALWLGYRYFSEDAFAWARVNAGKAPKVTAIYLADTKYQFRTDLPAGAYVKSAAALDEETLHGQYDDLILALQRRVELTRQMPDRDQMAAILRGEIAHGPILVSEADVHEALAAIRLTCHTKEDLRYILAASVVLNSWIESERHAGFPQRKRFYAFKQRVSELAAWANTSSLDGVAVWSERGSADITPLVCIRIDGIDFSFHAIPQSHELPTGDAIGLAWSGVRLKPVAPLVLAWARRLRDVGRKSATVADGWPQARKAKGKSN